MAVRRTVAKSVIVDYPVGDFRAPNRIKHVWVGL